MLIKAIKNFISGLVNSIEARAIPQDAASDVLNWLVEGDKWVLRRGSAIVGTNITGSGQITGLHTGFKVDGTEVTFLTYLQKIKYYDSVTANWIEIGSNQLGSSASGEEISFANYQSLAGAQTWLCSANSSLYKIMTANPGSITDEYLAAKNYKGRIRIKQNRMWLVSRTADKTGVYGSYIDAAVYTTVTDENIGTADGSTATFNDTLAFKAAGARRTCFAISVDAAGSSETFSDNNDGTLTGSLGGTGTINYTTGAISVTFATAPTGSDPILCDYQWEDSTNTGIADFTKSAPRTAGQGFIFRQDDGGVAQNVQSFKDIEYCFHEKKIWALTLTATDTNATNLIHRAKNGSPNWRGQVESGDGIYFVDDTDEKDPKIRLLTYDEQGSDQTVPVAISNNLDLSDFRFNKVAGVEFGDFVLFACRTSGSTTNNRVIMYDKIWKAFTILDYRVSCWAINNGALWAGDSISNNVYELFSGLDDDGSAVTNYLIMKAENFDIEGIKKEKRLMIGGEIGPDQDIEVYASIDNGAFVLLDTINGDGSYVDRTQAVTVGSFTIGRGEVGGGGSGITAYKFEKQIKLTLDRFEEIKLKFMATGVGWAAVSQIRHWDIRQSRRKIPRKYR